MSERRRRSQRKTGVFNYSEEENFAQITNKFVLGDKVFVASRDQNSCGIISEVLNEKPPRYLVNLYPYPTADRRWYGEHQLTKVTDSKEQLVWARDNEIDMEAVSFSALRYGLDASCLWQV